MCEIELLIHSQTVSAEIFGMDDEIHPIYHRAIPSVYQCCEIIFELEGGENLKSTKHTHKLKIQFCSHIWQIGPLAINSFMLFVRCIHLKSCLLSSWSSAVDVHNE